MPPVVVPSAAGMVASRFAFVPSGFGIRWKSMAGGVEASLDVLDEREVRIPARRVEGDEIGDLGDGGLGWLCWHDCS
jgi:hypothetical protein